MRGRENVESRRKTLGGHAACHHFALSWPIAIDMWEQLAWPCERRPRHCGTCSAPGGTTGPTLHPTLRRP